MSIPFVAIDVSGKKNVGNYSFMGMVFVTEEYLHSIMKILGRKKIHMSRIKNRKDRMNIVSKLSFDNKSGTALCIEMNRDVTIKKIQETRKMRHRNIPDIKIIRMYNRLLMYHLRERIIDLLIKYNCDLSDVVFECDHDCVGFAKDNGLKWTKDDYAHSLSDIVSWANTNDMEPEGTILIDLSEIIEANLRKALKL